MAKKAVKTKKVKKSKETAPAGKERYIEGIGRRKTSVARVRIFSGGSALGQSEITVNERALEKYFPLTRDQFMVLSPLKALSAKPLRIEARVSGGGLSGQAEAVRLGISRALVNLEPASRSKLKAYGFLKRDPRMVERKKFGSRKARRPQQWRKR